MRRFFVKNLLFVIIVNLLVKPLWVFLIDRTVQNRVGHADYGTYQALLNLSIIFNIILDFGLTYYNTKIISGQPSKLKTMFPAMLSARLVLIAAYATLVTITGFAIGYDKVEMLLLIGVLTIQSLNSLMLFLRSNVSALHKFKLDAMLSVTDRLLMIIICGFLLYYSGTRENFNISWFILVQIICYGIAVLLAFIVLQRFTRSALKLSFDLLQVWGIIKQSLPYASLVFLMAVHMRADTILVERLCGDEGKTYAGIYASGYRLLDVGNMFGVMFAGMLLPIFGRMLSQKTSVQPIVKLSVNILLPMSFIAVGCAFYFGTDIMELLYVNADDYSGQVFSWLMACFPAYSLMYVYSTLLTANNNLILLNKIAIVGVLINLSLNYYLIPTEHALGAAKTAFITQTTLALCYIYFSEKKTQLPKNLKWLAAHIGYILLLAGLGYCATLLPFNNIVSMCLFAAVSFAAVFIFRFITVSSVKSFLEKSKAD